MKILIWTIGKTNENYLEEGIRKYLKRLQHYGRIEYEEYKDVKAGINAEETLKREAELVLNKIKSDDANDAVAMALCYVKKVLEEPCPKKK